MNIGIIVNKEKDYTSRDVVNKLNKLLNTKKIGHTGTLDPMATGVLVCLVGKYTKLVNMLEMADKEYIASILIGKKTDTLDITGNILEEEVPRKLNEDEIKLVLNKLKGKYKQTIPLYSAKHVNGKRLYEYARCNQEVKLPQNIVEIKNLELISYNDNIITIKCVVSKGTYIRSLIQTICTELNVLGCMNSLERTRVGKFKIKDAFKLEDIKNGNYKKLKLEDILDVQIKKLDKTLEKKVINGNKLILNLDGYILFQKDNRDIALYQFINGLGTLQILF